MKQNSSPVTDFSRARHYLIAIAASFTVSGVCFSMPSHMDYHSVGMLLLLLVTILSLFLPRGAVFSAAAASACVWDFVFIPPRFGIIPTNFPDMITLVLYFAVAFVGTHFTGRLREKEAVVSRQERRTAALYSFVKDTTFQPQTDEIVKQIVCHLIDFYPARVAFYAVDEKEGVKAKCHWASPFQGATETLRAAAARALGTRKIVEVQNGNSEGFGRILMYPLISASGVEGVLGMIFNRTFSFSVDDESFLAMFVQQAALTLEKHRLLAKVQKTQMLLESDKLYKALFNSLSHELRTPLATICGASSSLIGSKMQAGGEAHAALVRDIFDAAQQLNRLVSNLLDMSRIESGAFKVIPQWCDMADIFEAVWNHLPSGYAMHPKIIRIDDCFPLLKMDEGLVIQALSNILLNAIQHSPISKPVQLTASIDSGIPTILVEDDGPGFGPDTIPFLFDKFYRVPGTLHHGTGLGLSIAKGFLEANKAVVSADNRACGGAVFQVQFPEAQQSSGSELTSE